MQPGHSTGDRAELPPDANPASQYYAGESGTRYFEEYQDPIAAGGSFLNVPLYQPFVSPGDVVLDFACGSGQLLSLLRAKRRLGVEISPAAVAAGRRRGLEIYERIEDVPPGSVDVVISNHGLEHTLEPHRVLSELRQLTRPGGRLVLYLPADSWWRERTYDPRDVNHHLYTWTPLLLGHLLSDAGWHVERSRLYFHLWPPHHYALLRYVPLRLAMLICRVESILRLNPQVHAVAVNREPS
jgi:SAM-dependent methyltransferase